MRGAFANEAAAYPTFTHRKSAPAPPPVRQASLMRKDDNAPEQRRRSPCYHVPITHKHSRLRRNHWKGSYAERGDPG